MGKKGNWFSTLKKAFTTSSKENTVHSSEKKHENEKKKWSIGKSKHGDINSFIPLYREPSSIEKILGEAEREQHHKIHQEPPKKVQKIHLPHQELPTNIQNLRQPKQEPPNKVRHHKAPKSKLDISPSRRVPAQGYAHVSAIRIQAAFRGYMARKNYRTLKGLVRLQRVVRGQSVKRQTTNTMKCMQLLVRVQSQVRTRRLQMIESRNLQQQQLTPRRSEEDMEGNFSKWSLAPQSEVKADGEWDDSMLTKDEKATRMRRKVEAVIKRERALAYAYSHQLLKVTPKSAHAVLTNARSGGFPWWWNWLDRQTPPEPQPAPLPKTPMLLTPKFTAAAQNAAYFRPSSHIQANRDISESPTPRSYKASASPRARNHPLKSPNKWKQSQLRDDDSLTSCPAFRPVPNYMAPTVSAKAKTRNSVDAAGQERDEGKKRFPFSLAQSIGSLRWSKGPLFSAKETVIEKRASKGKHRSTQSIGGLSVDSTVSLPAGVGRKPFK